MLFPSLILLISKPQSSLFFSILALGLYFNFILAIRRFFEVTDTLAERSADFGKLTGSENNQYDYEYDYKFRHPKSKHVSSVQLIAIVSTLTH